jgi:hypothetical protein
VSEITTLWLNVGHQDSPFDAFFLAASRDTQAAQLEALDGTVLSGTVNVTGGHKHTGGADQVLTWLQLGSWRISTSLDTTELASARINSTTDKTVLYGAFVLPSGVNDIYPAIRLDAQTHDVFATFDFYAPTSLTGSLATRVITCPHPITDSWVPAFASVNLSAIPLTNGLRLVYFRLQARMSGGGHAHLFEAQMGY